VRTLKVKCPTWSHVETFYRRKLRRDRTLTIRVPFNPEVGAELGVRLQLPDGAEVEIPGTVKEVLPDGTGQKAAITMHLHGFTDALHEQLRAAVLEHQSPPVVPEHEAPSQTAIRPPADSGRAYAQARLPASQPKDAPIDELVAPPYQPVADDISEFEREVFNQLETELVQLREFAAHEVFGLPVDADVQAIRQSYFQRTKYFHPDLFAKYRSPAIMYMAQEVFIHVNRAYDRMRDAAVREGRAVAAGPALLPHDGWLAGFDDIAASEPPPNTPSKSTPYHSAPPGSVQAQAAQFMAGGQLESARAVVAAALHQDPRNRPLRALYYVIGGEQALAGGDTVAAASQFEAALAHDRDCRPARLALDQLRARAGHGGQHTKSQR
jgi:hypothetical protein